MAVDWLDCRMPAGNLGPCDRWSSCWTAKLEQLLGDGSTWSTVEIKKGTVTAAFASSTVQARTGTSHEWKVGSMSQRCCDTTDVRYRLTRTSYNANTNGCPGDQVSMSTTT